MPIERGQETRPEQPEGPKLTPGERETLRWIRDAENRPDPLKRKGHSRNNHTARNRERGESRKYPRPGR